MMGYVLKKINPEEVCRCGLVLLQTPTAISIGRISHGNSRYSLLGPKNCTEHLTPINKWTFKTVSGGIALSVSLPLRELRSSQLKLLIKWWHGGGGVKHGCLASAVLLPKALHYCVASYCNFSNCEHGNSWLKILCDFCYRILLVLTVITMIINHHHPYY